MVSGSIYTLYPLYQSTKSEENIRSSAVTEERKLKFKREILLSPTQSPKFHLFCCEEHTQADLTFWKAVEAYQRIDNKREKINRAREIYRDCIPDVDFPDSIRSALSKYLAYLDTMSEEYLDIIFEVAQNHILGKMCTNQYDRFLYRSFTMPVLPNSHTDPVRGNKEDHRDLDQPASEASVPAPIENRAIQSRIVKSSVTREDSKENEQSINSMLSTSELSPEGNTEGNTGDIREIRDERCQCNKRTIGILSFVGVILVLLCWAAFPQLFGF